MALEKTEESILTGSVQQHFPLVSVLIPVYNRETLLAPCVQSALEQTVADIEIVVVDNASTDGTWQLCREMAAQDPRVRVFRNDENLGPVRNWLRCAEEARGIYGKILFSDDLMAPDYLEKTVPLLQRDDVGFAFTSAIVGPEPFQGEVRYQFSRQSGLFASSRYISMALFNGDVPLSPGGALFRMRDVRENLLLGVPSPTIHDFPRHGAGPDLLLYLVTAARYPQVAYLDEPLSYFRAHEGSITVSKEKLYLNRCYRQARLWFAERYLAETWLKRLYAYEWKRECHEMGKREKTSEIVARYTATRLTLTPLDLASGLALSRLVKKGTLTVPAGRGKPGNLRPNHVC